MGLVTLPDIEVFTVLKGASQLHGSSSIFGRIESGGLSFPNWNSLLPPQVSEQTIFEYDRLVEV